MLALVQNNTQLPTYLRWAVAAWAAGHQGRLAGHWLWRATFLFRLTTPRHHARHRSLASLASRRDRSLRLVQGGAERGRSSGAYLITYLPSARRAAAAACFRVAFFLSESRTLHPPRRTTQSPRRRGDLPQAAFTRGTASTPIPRARTHTHAELPVGQ